LAAFAPIVSADEILQGNDAVACAAMYSAKEARNRNFKGRLIVSRGNVFYRSLIRFDLTGMKKGVIKDAAMITQNQLMVDGSAKPVNQNSSRFTRYDDYVKWW
jgi:hypothetical protein